MIEQASKKSRPLVIGLPGSFDSADFASYDSWLQCLPELGVDVRVLDMFSLPGVKRIGNDERGSVYYCDWQPQDYFNLIKTTIDELQPSEVVLLGFSFGAYEAMRAAFALELLGRPVTGVVGITPAFLDYKQESYRPAGDWQKRPEAELGKSKLMNSLIEQQVEGFSRLLSCVRYEDLRNPDNGSINTFYMPEEVLQRYNSSPFRMHKELIEEIEEYRRLRFDSLAEVLQARHYASPTVLIAAAESSYYPPTRVNALARRIKNAPVGFIELPGVSFDFRANPAEVERVTETVMDKIGQLLHTKTVHQLRPSRTLLAKPRPAAGQPMETIVLSSARPPYHHKYAIKLAKAANANLAVLASHDVDPNIVATDLTRAGVSGCIIDFPLDFTLPLTADFATSSHSMVAERTSNLSLKRNFGLMFGRMAGQKIFFLDDDIRDLSVQKLHQTSAQLDHYTVAGFLPNAYPDNSMVCHANRLAGAEQAVFISGSSLGVDAANISSFFPNIYCEDWLFSHDAVKARKAVLIGKVRQLQYNPFDPKRATTEEFGDVLAEGLNYLLTAGVSHEQVGEDFWHYYIWRRRRFIADIASRLTALPGSADGRVPQALAALGASRRRLDTFVPKDFSSYIQNWRDDSNRWQERLVKLPKDLSFAAAVEFAASSFGLSAQIIGR